MIIFNFDADYKKYGGPLYGIPTNNGGYYLEGNPTGMTLVVDIQQQYI